MRRLSGLFDRAFDWATEGGLRRAAYKWFAGLFAVALVGEVAASGLTDLAYIYGCLVAGMLVCAYSDD